MKKLFVMALAAAVLCWWGISLADEIGPFDMPRIAVPPMPEIEVPEMPEIDVPEVPEARETQKPKIEVPTIPEVELPGGTVAADGGAEPMSAPDAAAQAALDVLGEPSYRATYDALLRGEVLKSGSTGDAARGVQQLLMAFGENIKVDGIVGPKTIAALNAVRARLGLPQSDSLDAAGFAALLPRLLTGEQAAGMP